jgi:hypothetical protein
LYRSSKKSSSTSSSSDSHTVLNTLWVKLSLSMMCPFFEKYFFEKFEKFKSFF